MTLINPIFSEWKSVGLEPTIPMNKRGHNNPPTALIGLIRIFDFAALIQIDQTTECLVCVNILGFYGLAVFDTHSKQR